MPWPTNTCRICCAAWAYLLTLGMMSSAAGQLVLSSPEPLQIPGISFGGDPDEMPITGSALDPVTGHLWVLGPAELSDDASEQFDEPGITEIDLENRQIASTIGRNYELSHGASLAIHPTTRNLWVAWLDVVDEAANLSGALEMDQSGDVESFVKISQSGDLLGHEGDWDPELYGPEPGLEVYLPSAAFSPSGELFWVYGGGPAYRFDPETLQVDEQFMFLGGPNTNYTSGAFDPVTGHWFVSTTSNWLLEVDPSSHAVLSQTDLSGFVPPPHPAFGTFTVQAFEFNRTGTQVILGGSFGLTVVQRAVPEPSALALTAGLVFMATIRRKSR